MLLLIINIIFFISFCSFAYVNLNDNDSWLWVPLYLIPAALCGLAAFGKAYPIVYLIFSVLYLIYATKLFFTKDGVKDWIFKYNKASIVATMQATKPYIEQTREFFGLLICVAAFLINYFATGI